MATIPMKRFIKPIPKRQVIIFIVQQNTKPQKRQQIWKKYAEIRICVQA